MASLRDLLDRQRTRLLADPSFQRWASRFPLTRLVARRRARSLFDLCNGFVYSQILQACVQLDLLERLRDGPVSAAELGGQMGMDADAADRLLNAAASLDLVSLRKDQCRLASTGATLLGNPALLAMIRHHALFYRDLCDPVGLLRGEAGETELQRYWAYVRDDDRQDLAEGRVADYSDLMSASQPLIADQVLAAMDLSRCRCLLDVGGGDGTFLAAVGRRAPHLQLMLFDLPAVADRARRRFAGTSLESRLTVHGGDFFADPLPPGADVISLVRVIHDHDDDRAMALLKSVRSSLPPGGTLLLAEPMSGTRGAETVGDAYFAFYLMAMGSGRPRSPRQLADMLSAAGFAGSRLVPTPVPLQGQLIVAKVS